MAKVLFTPVSILGGLLAGFAARKIVEQIWGLIDKDEPPDAKHRDISKVKMFAALAVEGAVFRTTKGAFDHYSRRWFERLTGTWPGEEEPEPE
jgi:Protein of unknown function (DUF4235)